LFGLPGRRILPGMKIPYRSAAIGLILAFASSLALAQQAPFAWDVTVTNTSAQAIGANPSRKRIFFYNGSASATVACAPAVSRRTGLALAAVVNGAGSITLLPYGSITIDDGVASGPPLFMPTPWNCISSAGSSPLTIYEFE
jgi:hypothetical protein